jgi:transmembrane sensor
MASIRWLLPTGLAAAAAIAVTFFTVFQTRTVPDAPMRHSATIVHPAPKRLALEDGSFVDLKAGAEFDAHFTPELRSLRLTCGEAHFTVAKDASRPFVVSVNNYTVRAVGTAFSIQVKDEGVSVLVTEGKVQLDEHANTQAGPNAHELSKLVAGQEAIIRSSAGRETQLLVRKLSPSELERATAWQAVRLEFVDLPLRDVIAEFNRHNHRKLALEDTATGNILVGGTFRADNLDGFVRLLQLGFGVSAQTTEQDTIVLRKN